MGDSMSLEREKAPADLSALRIRREPEKARGMRGWLLLAAILIVAAGAAAYLLAGRSPPAAVCGPAMSSSSAGPGPDRRRRPAAPRWEAMSFLPASAKTEPPS